MKQGYDWLQIVSNYIKENFHAIYEVDFQKVNWEKVFRKASQNRVLYAFAKNLMKDGRIHRIPRLRENLSTIISRGEMWLAKLGDTLKFLDSVLPNEGIRYLIVKTHKTIPYVTYDLDILVTPSTYLRTIEAIEKYGRLEKHPGKQWRKQRNFFAPGLLRVDVHKGFSWLGCDYLDVDLPWRNTRKVTIAGVSCEIPGPEAELLLDMAHILFERRYITLLDLICMRETYQESLDWAALLKQPLKYGWSKSFYKLTSIVNELNSKLYPAKQDALMIDYGVLGTPKIPSSHYMGKVDMPYMIPLPVVIGSLRERTSWEGKLPKWDLAYYFLTTFKYYASGRKLLPYYIEWAPRLKWR